MLIAAGGDHGIEAGGEEVEAGVIGEAERYLFPLAGGTGDFFHDGQLASGQGDAEHVARVIGFAFGKAVGFVGAAVPCFGVDLFGPMPVTQSDIIDGLDW